MLDGAGAEHAPVAGEVRGDSRARHLPRDPRRAILRSATRPLEVIELFAVRRCPLSVSEIAVALGMPQSSSSVLLQAMCWAGFIVRDQSSRKYLPGVRSVLFGGWMQDTTRQNGSLIRALDQLAEEARAQVRLGVRNGLCIQLVHVSSRVTSPRAGDVKPGMKLPVAHDALGRMLLVEESERDLRAILRHANASCAPMERVDPEALAADLRRHRRDGFAICRHGVDGRDAVLAIRLPSQYGAVAAIGFALPASRLPAERSRLLGELRAFAGRDWCGGVLDAAGASPD